VHGARELLNRLAPLRRESPFVMSALGIYALFMLHLLSRRRQQASRMRSANPSED
jgi:hypothetical protein